MPQSGNTAPRRRDPNPCKGPTIFNWHSLRTRILLLSLLILVFGIWALALYTSGTLRGSMERQLGDQQFATVSILAAQFDGAVAERIASLEFVATEIGPAMAGDPVRVQRLLDQRPLLQRFFNAGLFITRRDGIAIADAPKSFGRIGTNFIDRPGIARAMDEDKTAVGRPVMSRVLNAPLFAIATPLRNLQGTVVGVLVGVTDLSRPNFLDEIAKASYGRTGGYLLVSPGDKLIITASDKRLVMTESIARDPLVQKFMQGHEGSGVLVNPFGVEMLASARRVPTAGWYLSAVLPTTEAFAPIDSLRQHIMIASAVLTLLTALLIWWMLRRQLAPMLATVQALATLPDATQAHRPFPVARQDEVGELIGGFNRLLAVLRERELALKEGERRFRAIVEASPVPFFMHDEKGNIIFINQAFTNILGYTVEDMPTQSAWWSLAYPEATYRQQLFDEWKRRRESGVQRNQMETSIVCKSGEVRSFIASSSNLEKEFSGSRLVALYDITERKRIEETQARLAAIVENSNDAIIGVSLEGQIFSWNATATRMFGYSAAEAIGQNIAIIIPPDRNDETARNREVRARSREVLEMETVRRTKDGQAVQVSLRVSSITDSSGKLVGASLIMRDISGIKRAEAARTALEEQLRESQKMQAIGTLAGGIAHDFNNIIAAILGNAELASQDAGNNPVAQQSLEEIRKAGRRARELVQQILAFSRRQPAERKPMSLATVVEESARLLRSTLPARISLEVQQAPGLPLVLADATQMQQVLLNLATNAMQAIGQVPGRIHVRLDKAVLDEAMAAEHPALRTLREAHAGTVLRLSVTDTGPGMDRATQERIFEPFFTTKAVGEGTGLGLSVVHGIVQSHQGAIVVRSRPGAGTSFTVYLPEYAAAEEPDAGKTTAAGTEPPPALEGHVLYLDDDRFLVGLVKRLLERRGLRVSTFLDQKQALAALRARPGDFDLVVSDYNMPGMSGLDVAREVRSIRHDLPVVVASGFVDEALQAQAREAGVREVLFKAEAMESFCEVILRLMRRGAEAGADSSPPA